MLLNEDLVHIEKSDGICSFVFVADEFSGLFLHSSIFYIIHSRSAVSPEEIFTLQKSLFFLHALLCNSSLFEK